MPRHWASLALILLVVAGIYARVTRSYYCGYDDFFETHRAAFEDSKHPSHIFTTTHFGTPKYRPLSRGLSFLSYKLGNGNPIAYRLRNLVFHLLGIAAVYGLGYVLFNSWGVAAGSALLFGLHPLANQVVNAASFTNTAANFFLLSSFFSIIYSRRSKRRPMVWLGISLFSALIAVFIYESSIVAFAMLYAYVAIVFLREPQAIGRRFLAVLIAGTVIIGVIFMGARLLVAPMPAHVTPPLLLLKNSAMYAAALLLPVDSVLAHAWFGTPLPSELKLDLHSAAVWSAAIVAGAAMLAVVLVLWKQRQRLDWLILLVLAGCAAVSLLPFLMFNPHPSETYLYLPAAFFCLILCGVLRRLLPGNRGYASVILMAALLFGAATWVRNDRVAACGNTAETILSQLPIGNWRTGSWFIHAARAPGEPVVTRYGLYNYQGLWTIDVEDADFNVSSLQCALQTATDNEQLRASVKMPDLCAIEGTCFWVYNDGRVAIASGSGSSRRAE